MKTCLLIMLLCLIAVPAYADWTKADTLREVAWQGIHIMDWGTTLDMARQPDKYHEINPILGKHPSVGKVNLYMGLSAIGHMAVSYALPEKIRPYWQYITIGISSACVINNFNVGLKVKF